MNDGGKLNARHRHALADLHRTSAPGFHELAELALPVWERLSAGGFGVKAQSFAH
ncbi:MAG: hypothetical protein M0005_00185 [Actinomycetota bacterium]|nr:hypothetical protein [Actinomycetota bacterium]